MAIFKRNGKIVAEVATGENIEIREEASDD